MLPTCFNSKTYLGLSKQINEGKMKLTEKMIEDSILIWLNLQYQCFAFKLNTRGQYNPVAKAFMFTQKHAPKHMPDVIFCYAGLFGSFEIKTPEAHRKFMTSRSEHEMGQKRMIEHLRSKGALAEVVSSLSQVQIYIERLQSMATLLKQGQ